ncbi:putative protein phosphatase 2C 78, partial [Drosera capensis]
YAAEQGGLSTDATRPAIKATEEDSLKFAKKARVTDPEVALSGSCCLVGVISDGTSCIANVGDSRAVLGRRVCDGEIFCLPSAMAQRLTSDRNVGIEAVRKEVRALHPNDVNIVVHTRGFWRIKGIIQVSRAIGDIYLKRPEFSNLYRKFGSSVPLKRAVISAEPSISMRQLNPDDLFIIFASDGLWEHFSDEAAVEIIYRNPRFGIPKRLIRAAIDEAARKRGMTYEDMSKIDIVMRRLFDDDISVIVLYLDHSIGGRYIGSKDYSHFSYSMTPSQLFSYDSCEALDGISSDTSFLFLDDRFRGSEKQNMDFYDLL